MRARNLSALILALFLAIPARAADQVRALSLGGAGPTASDSIIAVCDSTHLLIIDRSATSGTNAGKLITWTSGSAAVTTFSLYSPSTSSYGHARAAGCNGTTIVIAGGPGGTTAGSWIASSSISSPGTWTTQEDRTSWGAQFPVGVISETPPGSRTWITAWYEYAGGVSKVWAHQMTLNGGSITSTSGGSYAAGSAAWTDQGCSGIKASSTHLGASCFGASATAAIGSSGTAVLWGPSTGPINCGTLTGTLTARTSFAANGNYYHVADNGTSTIICGISWNGSSSSRFADQTLSSLLMRGGIYFGGETLIWKSTDGTAYVGGGSVASYFSDRSSSSMDFAPDSGSIIQVVLGIDVDGDGSATDNPLALFTSGNAAYYGEALPVALSATRPRRTSLSGALGGSLGGSL